MLTMPPRHGKLCADDTDVLTADGWKKHGSLVPGDFVYGVDGRPVRVLAVGEPDFATHRVTMTDGSFVDVHLDHEWTFRDRGRNRTRTVETREVLESSLWLGERGRRGGRARWQLPLHGPVAGTERDLPLPPYVLGVWLGDGTSTKPYITMSPQDMPIVKQSFAELGYHPSAEFLHKQTGVPTVAYSTGHAGVRGAFAQALCDLGVLGNKHIPEQYKTASVSQRLELLAGLIDTDGHVDATGCAFRLYFRALLKTFPNWRPALAFAWACIQWSRRRLQVALWADIGFTFCPSTPFPASPFGLTAKSQRRRPSKGASPLRL